MATPFDFTSEVVLRVNLNDPSAAKVLDQLKKKFGSIPVSIDFNNKRVLGEIAAVEKGLQKSTRAAKDFGDQIVLSGKRFAGYAVASTVLIGISNSFSEATREAIRFGKEVGKLKQTFPDTEVNGKAILDLAKKYGLSSLKIAETVRVLGQAGGELGKFNKAIQVTEALVQTTLLASFDDLSSSTEAVIALLESFKLTTDEVAESLAIINILSKKYAIEANDLTSAVKRVGGVFAATGGNFKELATLITQVRSTTRESADVIATGFKTIFSSLQRPKTIEFFRELGIQLDDGTGKFVGNYKAIQLINQGLRDLNIVAGDLRFAEVVEEIGGIRQSSRVIPLLTDFERIQEIYNTAGSGSGEIAADLIKAQETLANKLDRLRQNFLAFVNEIVSNKSFQVLADLLIRAANAAIELGRALNNINIGGFSILLPLLAGRTGLNIFGEIKKALPNRLPEIFGPTKLATGGFVPGVGNRDTVKALLTPGEYVINKKSAEAFGYNNLDRINRYARGGKVDKNQGGRSPGEVRDKLYQEIEDLKFQLLLESNPRQKASIQQQLDRKEKEFAAAPKINNRKEKYGPPKPHGYPFGYGEYQGPVKPDYIEGLSESEVREQSNQAFKEKGREVEARAKASGQAKRVATARKGVLGVRDSRTGDPLQNLDQAKEIAKNFAETLGETGETVKNALEDFNNVVESEGQPANKKGRASKKRGKSKVELNPVSATDYTVQHEVAHVADLSLGEKGFASEKSGTLQNVISEIVKPSLAEKLSSEGASPEEINYRTQNKEIFADTLVEADPKLRSILVSTTNVNKGMADVAAYMEEVRSTTGKLPAIFTGVEDRVLEFARVVNPSAPVGTFNPNAQQTPKILEDIGNQMDELNGKAKKVSIINPNVSDQPLALPQENTGGKFITQEQYPKRRGTIPTQGSGPYGGFGGFIGAGTAPPSKGQDKVYGGFGSFIGAGNNAPVYGPPKPPGYPFGYGDTQGPRVPTTLADFEEPTPPPNEPPKGFNVAILATLASVAGEVTKSYIDQETKLYDVVKLLTDMATTIAVVTSSLAAFGVEINTGTIKKLLGFGDISSKIPSGIVDFDFKKYFPTFISSFEKVQSSVIDLAPKFGMLAARASIIAGAFYGLNKLIDIGVGYEKDRLKAIKDGNVDQAGDKAIRAANAELFTSISSVTAGLGVLLLSVNPLVGGFVLATAAVIKLAEASESGQSALNSLRDTFALFFNIKSSKEIEQESRNEASKNNLNRILDNTTFDKKGFDNPEFKNVATALSQRKIETNDLARTKRQALASQENPFVTGLGGGLTAFSQKSRSDRLDQEINAAQESLKSDAERIFKANEEVINSLGSKFINSGGSDFSTFINSLGDGAKEMISLSGNMEKVRKEFATNQSVLSLQNKIIKANINLLSAQEAAQRQVLKVTKGFDAASSSIDSVRSGLTGGPLSINTETDKGLLNKLGAGSATQSLDKIKKFEDFFSESLVSLGGEEGNADERSKKFKQSIDQILLKSDLGKTLEDAISDNLASIEFGDEKSIQDGINNIRTSIEKARGPFEKSISELSNSTQKFVNDFNGLVSAAGDARRSFLEANFERQSTLDDNLRSLDSGRTGFGFSDLMNQRRDLTQQVTPEQNIRGLVEQRTALESGNLQDPNTIAAIALVNDQIKDQTMLNQQSIVVRQKLIENLKEELELEKQRSQAIQQTLDVFSLATREEKKRIAREIEVAQILDSGGNVNDLSRRQKEAVPNALKLLDPAQQQRVSQEVRQNSLQELVSRGTLNPNSNVARNFGSVARFGQTSGENNVRQNIVGQFRGIDSINRQNNSPLEATAQNFGNQLNTLIDSLNNGKFNTSIEALNTILATPLKIEFPTDFSVTIENNNDLIKVLNDQVKIEVAKAIAGQRNGQ